MALITCPECNTEFSEQQLKNIGMCPSCGLPESEVREHMPPPPPSEPQPKQQTVEKNDDTQYKTTASKLLSVFAWITWISGIIDVLAIAMYAGRLRASYYASETAGTTLFFIAVCVAVVSLFFGGLLFGASKLLIDIHATRLNLERLNAKKEAEQ